MSSQPLPILLQPAELALRLGEGGLLPVDLRDQGLYLQGHLPGAVQIDYKRLAVPRPPAMGEVPEAAALEALLSEIGLTRETQVVAYDGEGNGKASRLVWTLHLVGHRRAALLDGGIGAWAGERLPLEAGLIAPRATAYRIAEGGAVGADREYVLSRLGDPGVVILDSRSPAEFSGADLRAARGGHIPGAVNLDWVLLRDPKRGGRLKPAAELKALFAAQGIEPSQEVIVHCQTHHRSSLTYVALKTLGYAKVRGYAGSWSEWGNDLALPVER